MEALIVLAIILVAGLIAWVVLTQKPPSATAAALSQRLASVQYMSGSQFEHFVADIMRGLGYRAEVLGGSGDQGVDVIATGGRGERIAIQCKQYDRPVGNKPVQEVFAGAKHHRCPKAMVVAPMGFTKGAIALARSVGVDLHDRDSLRMWIRQIQPAPQERRTVDLDVERAEQKEDTMTEGNMKKHTISVGTDTIGETVSFTAKLLGTAKVNGGKEAEGGMDWTYYRLPDHTYRVLVESQGVSMLQTSNMAEALDRGEPVEYGRWTLEELQDEGEYGRVFAALMEKHPEGRKRNVRDLD